MSDNITAISYVNNKGGIKPEFCIEIEKKLWMWFINKATKKPRNQVSYLDSRFSKNHTLKKNEYCFRN